MFKCCVCNSASKKTNAERLKADDTSVESPKLTTISAKVDNEIEPATKVDKLNGNVQKSEKTSLLENNDVLLKEKDALLKDKNVSLEDKDISLENQNVSLKNKDASLENKDVLLEDKDSSLEDKNVSLKDVSLDDKDTSPEDKDASLENKDVLLEDKDASLEDKNVSLEDKDTSLEDKDVWLEAKSISLEDENASLKNKDTLSDSTPVIPHINFTINSPCEIPQNGNVDAEESSSSTSTKETVEEVGEETGDRIIDNKDGITENWTKNSDFDAIRSAKMNLYDASGYIERTIDNGPEDEGDDSVFENENEMIQKAPPVASIPRWLSEEDDGEYISGGCSGIQEPPATPIARDELALRRHRFFSDLLQAAQNSTEHRVRFDPLGPMVHTG